MLIHELDGDTLLIAQATPRKWLEDGKRIEVSGAPTYYGKFDATIESRAASGKITAAVNLEGQRRPATLLVRLRHPASRPMKAVTVNGRQWKDYDGAKEWVRIAKPDQARYEIEVSY